MKAFEIKVWLGVTVILAVFWSVLIFALNKASLAINKIEVDTSWTKPYAAIALVICVIILIAQAIARAGVKYTLPVTRYIITDGPAPDGVTRLNPGARETGDFLMVMAAKSEARMCGRELGGDVEITIATEPNIDIEAQFSLEYLRRNSGKHGIEVK